MDWIIHFYNTKGLYRAPFSFIQPKLSMPLPVYVLYNVIIKYAIPRLVNCPVKNSNIPYQGCPSLDWYSNGCGKYCNIQSVSSHIWHILHIICVSKRASVLTFAWAGFVYSTLPPPQQRNTLVQLRSHLFESSSFIQTEGRFVLIGAASREHYKHKAKTKSRRRNLCQGKSSGRKRSGRRIPSRRRAITWVKRHVII